MILGPTGPIGNIVASIYEKASCLELHTASCWPNTGMNDPLHLPQGDPLADSCDAVMLLTPILILSRHSNSH